MGKEQDKKTLFDNMLLRHLYSATAIKMQIFQFPLKTPFQKLLNAFCTKC